MNACADPSSCLAERRKHMSYQPGDPRNWHPSPCLNCKVGKQRQQQGFTPEPDIAPYRNAPIIPWHVPVKPRRHDRTHCGKCGKELSTSAKYSGTSGVCYECFKQARRPPEKCVVGGCVNKARRKGLCRKHATELADRGNDAAGGPGKVRIGT